MLLFSFEAKLLCRTGVHDALWLFMANQKKHLTTKIRTRVMRQRTAVILIVSMSISACESQFVNYSTPHAFDRVVSDLNSCWETITRKEQEAAKENLDRLGVVTATSSELTVQQPSCRAINDCMASLGHHRSAGGNVSVGREMIGECRS